MHARCATQLLDASLQHGDARACTSPQAASGAWQASLSHNHIRWHTVRLGPGIGPLFGLPLQGVALEPPALDFSRSRYGHGYMLAERLGELYVDVVATGNRLRSTVYACVCAEPLLVTPWYVCTPQRTDTFAAADS